MLKKGQRGGSEGGREWFPPWFNVSLEANKIQRKVDVL